MTLLSTPGSGPSLHTTVNDSSGLEPGPFLYPKELQLALRNRALPLEALRYERTPTGLHYTLTHYDIPFVASTYPKRTRALVMIGGFPRRVWAADYPWGGRRRQAPLARGRGRPRGGGAERD